MATNTDLSVIMSVYHKDKPAALRTCLDSLLGQTLQAEEILVTADGPLGAELDAVLAEYSEYITLFRLPENRGSAVARQRSLDEVNTTYFAVMDADDVCLPQRFATQLPVLVDGNLDVVGAAMYEFDGDGHGAPEDLVIAQRAGTKTSEIASRVKIATPFNHPTVLMRTESVRAAGGYRAVAFLEDYDLFARLLANGAKAANLAEPLLYFRVNDAMFQRRLNKQAFVSEWQLQRNLVSYGLISWPRAVFNFLLRNTFRLLPRPLLRLAYRVLFRSAARTAGTAQTARSTQTAQTARTAGTAQTAQPGAPKPDTE